MVAVAPSRHQVRYEPRGAAKELLGCRDFEVLVEGPVGTGKSYGVLWKAHLAALKYSGMRGILLRKTQKSLTESAIQTYMKILQTANYGVQGFSGNIEEPRAFKYPNGSRLGVCGLDNAGKVMSAEYDLAVIFESTQVRLEDVEAVTTRLRNGVMPYQQLIMDCNPDAPSHWLNQRALTGRRPAFAPPIGIIPCCGMPKRTTGPSSGVNTSWSGLATGLAFAASACWTASGRRLRGKSTRPGTPTFTSIRAPRSSASVTAIWRSILHLYT